jgi:hypothetical protein
MNRVITTVALTFALGASALSPALAQNADQRRSMTGIMGGGCPMIGMMGQGMMGPGMMAPGLCERSATCSRHMSANTRSTCSSWVRTATRGCGNSFSAVRPRAFSTILRPGYSSHTRRTA